MREEIGAAMKSAGGSILAEMRAQAPVLKLSRKDRVRGALRDALSLKFYANTLRLRIGFVGVAANRTAFYARFLEFGRGIKNTIDSKGRHIGVINPQLFVFGRRTILRDRLEADVKGIWRRALDKAAAGAEGGDG